VSQRQEKSEGTPRVELETCEKTQERKHKRENTRDI
jgi:hypothetical protein